ncbi:MAG: hypothetical protein P4M14_12630 [Gammaproteobacteria bacterium]|nr:hypothetical protein [Gammaproteobacteria bacterium]
MQGRFHSISMGNAIHPSIKFRTCPSALPTMQAIYIESCHEYFTEIPKYEDRLSLLESLDYILKTNPEAICLFDLPLSEEPAMLEGIIEHLGEDSTLEARFRQQQDEEYHIEEFLDECKQKKIDTVYIGGVYGRACVWDAARTMADTIYSKQLGDKHPNIRFAPTDQSHRFAKAIILGEFTQGYTDAEATFDKFICFPRTALFTTNRKDHTDIVALIEDQLENDDTNCLGRSYESYNSLDSANTSKFYALHYAIQSLVSQRLFDRPTGFLLEMSRNKQKTIQSTSNESQPTSDTDVKMGYTSL